MDDDYLLTIRSGGSPAVWFATGIPGVVMALLIGMFGAFVLAMRGELGYAGLAFAMALVPPSIVVPLLVHFRRKHQRFVNILKNGQRVWGEVLAVERGMGRWRRRGGTVLHMAHQGVFVTGTVQVRVRLADGAFHVGACKGWYRPAELEALGGGAPAPVIYLPGIPEVIVARSSPE